jgi:hypothetical protein
LALRRVAEEAFEVFFMSCMTSSFEDATGNVKEGPGMVGGLNRSTQHFILEGKDGVWDGTKIS